MIKKYTERSDKFYFLFFSHWTLLGGAGGRFQLTAVK